MFTNQYFRREYKIAYIVTLRNSFFVLLQVFIRVCTNIITNLSFFLRPAAIPVSKRLALRRRDTQLSKVIVPSPA